MRSRWIAGVLALAATGCGESSQTELEVPLRVAGSPAQPIETSGGWTVTLDRADVAFGPLYLCAGAQAGELCETALLDWTGSVVVDALGAAPQAAGSLRGTTGTQRSFMYDLGIVSLLTQTDPVPLAAARRLGGNSVAIAGRAERGAERIEFSAGLKIAQAADTEQGIPVVRGRARTPEALAPGDQLTVRFDPYTWVGDIDFDALSDAGDGRIADDSQAARAIRNAVTSGFPPEFEWR